MVTVKSSSGAQVRVEVVEGGRLALVLALSSGTAADMASTTSHLPHDIFTALVSQKLRYCARMKSYTPLSTMISKLYSNHTMMLLVHKNVSHNALCSYRLWDVQ